MLQFSTAPLTMKKIWQMGFKLCFARLVPVYFLTLLQQLSIVFLQNFFVGAKNSLNSILAIFKAHWLALSIYFVADFIFTIFIIALVTHQLGTLMQGMPSRFNNSFKLAFKKAPALLLASVISLLAILIGIVVFVLPGIFLMIAFFFYSPFIILDNLKPIAALKQAIRITWGRWWRSVTVVVIAVLLPALVTTILLALISISLLFLPISTTVVGLAITILQLLLQSFTALYLASVLLVQWHDLKIRYENKQWDLL